MDGSVTYAHRDGVGWIDVDDGKVNALSPDLQQRMQAALDSAERDDAVVVLRGRPGVLSAGFDMAILTADGDAAAEMVIGGFELARRLLAHPRPVVIACTGHAIAMGAFLLLAGDHRIAVDEEATIAANEVAIGLTMPRTAIELMRGRLTPAALQLATLLSTRYRPRDACAAGFVDEVVPAAALDGRVAAVAAGATSLDRDAQLHTKRRLRAPLLHAVDVALAQDRAELLALAGR